MRMLHTSFRIVLISGNLEIEYRVKDAELWPYQQSKRLETECLLSLAMDSEYLFSVCFTPFKRELVCSCLGYIPGSRLIGSTLIVSCFCFFL